MSDLTLRQHLEAIRDANHPMESGGILREQSYAHAVAALTIIAPPDFPLMTGREWILGEDPLAPDVASTACALSGGLLPPKT